MRNSALQHVPTEIKSGQFLFYKPFPDLCCRASTYKYQSNYHFPAPSSNCESNIAPQNNKISLIAYIIAVPARSCKLTVAFNFIGECTLETKTEKNISSMCLYTFPKVDVFLIFTILL